jgi:hypothetical protein
MSWQLAIRYVGVVYRDALKRRFISRTHKIFIAQHAVTVALERIWRERDTGVGQLAGFFSKMGLARSAAKINNLRLASASWGLTQIVFEIVEFSIKRKPIQSPRLLLSRIILFVARTFSKL